MLTRIFQAIGIIDKKRELRVVQGVVERLGFDHHRTHSGPEWLLALERHDRPLRLLDASDLPQADHEALSLTRPGDRVILKLCSSELSEPASAWGPEPGSIQSFRNFDLESRFPAMRSPEQRL